MKRKNTTINGIFKLLSFATLLSSFLSCSKLVEVDPPLTSTNSSLVYASDATATAVLTGIYTSMNQNGPAAMALYAGLSSDELSLFNGINDINYQAYYQNNLNAAISAPGFWQNFYSIIFVTNAAIEGITASTTLTPTVQRRLLGEAKFLRAFCYFYLVNLYGDVPLNITTDYKKNSVRGRTSKDEVYKQVIADLKEAQELLDSLYIDAAFNSTSERTRPNKFAAKALLARVYLYVGEYGNALSEATNVLDNVMLYDTVSLNQVFLKNSKESIWSLQPIETGTWSNTAEGRLFILPDIGPSGANPVYLSNGLLSEFDSEDRRLTNWIQSVTANGEKYYYAFKYRLGAVDVATDEYGIILRLAEQYLIRAEARANLGDIGGAINDLNVIRKRAGLPNISINNKEALLEAILNERQLEFFTEWGHRWFDLKRMGKADTILGAVKGSNWQATDKLYPIPLNEIERNPSIRGHQNDGYN